MYQIPIPPFYLDPLMYVWRRYGKRWWWEAKCFFGLRPFWTLGFLALLFSKHRSSSSQSNFWALFTYYYFLDTHFCSGMESSHTGRPKVECVFWKCSCSETVKYIDWKWCFLKSTDYIFWYSNLTFSKKKKEMIKIWFEKKSNYFGSIKKS